MNFLAGYYPRILHIINTLSNFRPSWENFASPSVFLHCGCWKPVDRQGAEARPKSRLLSVVGLGCPLAPLLMKRGWCLETKENLSENLSPLQGRDLECSHPFELFPVQCIAWKKAWGNQITVKNTLCSLEESAPA